MPRPTGPIPANGGFFLPLWFQRDVAKADARLHAGEITEAEHRAEIEFLNREYEDQHGEFRAGRG